MLLIEGKQVVEISMMKQANIMNNRDSRFGFVELKCLIVDVVIIGLTEIMTVR